MAVGLRHSIAQCLYNGTKRRLRCTGRKGVHCGIHASLGRSEDRSSTKPTRVMGVKVDRQADFFLQSLDKYADFNSPVISFSPSTCAPAALISSPRAT